MKTHSFLSTLYHLSPTPKKKVHKPVKSQAIKYAPVSYEQQREPTYAAHPQPQHVKAPSQPVRFIEYEEETTQRAIQYVQQQSKAQRIPAPASPSRHQQQYDVGIHYSQQQPQQHQQQEIRPFQTVTQKYQQYENRSPPVFPVEQATATPRLQQNEETAQQRYSLFNPAAAPRYDVYTRSKVRKEKSRKALYGLRSSSHKSNNNKRRRRNRSFIVIVRKRRYFDD